MEKTTKKYICRRFSVYDEIVGGEVYRYNFTIGKMYKGEVTEKRRDGRERIRVEDDKGKMQDMWTADSAGVWFEELKEGVENIVLDEERIVEEFNKARQRAEDRIRELSAKHCELTMEKVEYITEKDKDIKAVEEEIAKLMKKFYIEELEEDE